MYTQEEENEVFQVINKLRKLAIRNTFLPVSHVEFMMLHIISNATDKKIKISDIAINMSVSMPAVSKMLRNLEEKDYIMRINNENDRRVTYVTITENGQQILDEAFKMIRQLTNRVTQRIGKEKINQLVSLFKELNMVMLEELEANPIKVKVDDIKK